MSATTTTATDANGTVIQNYQILKSVRTGSLKLVASHRSGTPFDELLVLVGGGIWVHHCNAAGKTFGFTPEVINPANFVVVGTREVA
jgi:hypothetical protein